MAELMGDLRGKTAVVTGAASGIGYALCEAFAGKEMRVAMADVQHERLEDAARRLERAGAEVLTCPTDVTRSEDVENLAAQTLDAFGAVHVLCNNAGVQQDGYAWEFSLEEWRWVLGVNLWGVIHGIKAFVPGMVERGETAHVVNTASVGGLVTFPRITMYTASKAGVVGLSEGLYHDLRARAVPIGVSVLCPGPVMSSLREHSRALRPGGEEAGPIQMMTHVERVPASVVATMVLDAIATRRFWILTHPEYNAFIERRFRGIVETDEVVEASLSA